MTDEIFKFPNQPPLPAVSGFSTASQVAPRTIEMLELSARGVGDENSVALDLLPEPGLLPGTITVICGLPGVGKSTFLANIALRLLQQQRLTAVFLPDHTKAAFMAKLIGLSTGIAYHRLISGRISREEWTKLTAATMRLCEAGLCFSDSTRLSRETIARELDQAQGELGKTGRKLSAVLVDSLNYLAPNAGYFTEEPLKETVSRLKLKLVAALTVPETPSIRKGFIQLPDLRQTDFDEENADFVYNLNKPYFYDDGPNDGVQLTGIYGKDRFPHNLNIPFDPKTGIYGNPDELEYGRPPF